MERFNLEIWLEDKSRKVIDDDGFPVEIIKLDANEKCPVVYLNHNGIAYNVSVDGMYDSDPNHGLFFADEEEELTELQKTLEEDCDCYVNLYNDGKTREELREWIKGWCHRIIDLVRKELEKENSEFKPKFTYNEKDYSKLANKLIEFRNNTPLCSVSYRDGEGRKIILHYEKEILDLVRKELEKSIEDGAIEFAKSYMEDVNPSFEKVQESEELWKWKMSCLKGVNKAYTNGKQDALKDVPKWKYINQIQAENHYAHIANGIISPSGYFISYDDLEALPKEG